MGITRSRADRDTFRRQDAFVDALVALVWPRDDETPGHVAVCELIREHKLTNADFVTLDAKPGYFGYRQDQGGWHWKLRRTRNSGEGAGNLFAALQEVSE